MQNVHVADAFRGFRLFLAQIRVILTRLLYVYELDLANGNAQDWLKRPSYLAFEPRELFVKLHAREDHC
jgi:hypothetical protein